MIDSFLCGIQRKEREKAEKENEVIKGSFFI
jgi:hypothetical protein